MAHKNKQVHSNYINNYLKIRRNKFFRDKTCVLCGSTENLELDHINPEEKITHRVWGWSKERREEELSKCQVLCYICHKKKSQLDKCNNQRHFSDEQIRYIRNSDKTGVKLAKEFSVHKTTIYGIIKRKRYACVE